MRSLLRYLQEWWWTIRPPLDVDDPDDPSDDPVTVRTGEPETQPIPQVGSRSPRPVNPRGWIDPDSLGPGRWGDAGTELPYGLPYADPRGDEPSRGAP